jgi:hypothetical protein
LWVLFWVFCLSLPCGVQAQNQQQEPTEPVTSEALPEAAEEPEEITVVLPGSQQMAMALATPPLRNQALLDLAVAAKILDRARGNSDLEVDHAALAQNFLDDRAWLQMLVDQFGWVKPHSSVLDPAAWLVLGELQQHDLEDMSLVFPGRTPEPVLIYQVFQRATPRLAAANVPVLLYEIEADAIAIWDAFLLLTASGETRHAAWKEVEIAWFTDRQLPEAAEPGSEPEPGQLTVEEFMQALSRLVVSAVDVAPPDSKGLIQLRYSLLTRLAQTPTVENSWTRDQLRDALYLAGLIDGLHDGRYFDFAQGLLAITSRLLELPEQNQQAFYLVDWLVAELPAISAHYATDFASVDPSLNATMTATYEVLLDLTEAYAVEPGPETEAEASEPGGESSAVEVPAARTVDIKASRAVLADAVAQLALLIPDMGYYFDTPVRGRIVEEINICISIAAGRGQDGQPTMTRRQFDGCMETLLRLAERDTRLPELSGDMNGPFTTDTLRRELSVTPWQRINFAIGWLDERYSTPCQPPANTLPNPLEWAVLATTLTWFAEHSPEFFSSSENEGRLTQMRNIGGQLIRDMAEQAQCLADAGPGINDVVRRVITDYELALRELESGIEKAEADFRAQRLSPGADILLDEDASQTTGYRPVELQIGPCDTRAVCEMSGALSTTRALIGLFPDEYLIAEQAGMGRIEICYRDMEWVQRRSELVRADDENVANYYGRLGFNLVGRYIEDEQETDIFDFRFTSPEEYHYLFAQTSAEVLDDSCPVEWVGSRVVTPLREKRGGIVPDRLTYLAASRKLPSRLMQNNWDRGAEWRDWFVTGIGVTEQEVPEVPDITIRLNQHLQAVYQAGQEEIYQRVLLPNARDSQGEDVSLFDEMSEVSIAKAMIRMQMMLFYPESMFNLDTIRMAVAGDSGLLDGRTMRRFREQNVALTSVNGIARERVNRLREVWLKQPEELRRKGSIPGSLMYALTRINLLYRQLFIARPEPLQEIEVTAEPQQ